MSMSFADKHKKADDEKITRK